MNQDQKKERVSQAAIQFVEDDMIVGVGTGSTVNFFIKKLAHIKHRIRGAVASSVATEKLLNSHQIPVFDLNAVDRLAVYIDGADEATRRLHLIKGGGGALTREKIIAAASERFVCIVDDSKMVQKLGAFPLPVEVIQMAQNHVRREIMKLGGQPVLRDGFLTDNGNIILDVKGLAITEPIDLEQALNNITGIVTNGLFARRPADILLVASVDEVQLLEQ